MGVNKKKSIVMHECSPGYDFRDTGWIRDGEHYGGGGADVKQEVEGLGDVDLGVEERGGVISGGSSYLRCRSISCCTVLD